MNQKLKIMSVFGTRPEAIKMCPLINKMQQCNRIDSVVCVTAQHRYMLDQVLNIFQIVPKYDLDLMRKKQSLTEITSGIVNGMEKILQKEYPDLVLVHGDTTTSFAVALSAFYQKIPVGHVEAGLRTHDRYSPFPEEMNRQLTARLAELHFAPTIQNKKNLLAEGICNNVYVTGNTVIDSFAMTVKENYYFKEELLNTIDFDNKKVILMTAHRRENIGGPLRRICLSIERLVIEHKDIEVIYPVHLNPAVRETVFSLLGDKERIHLIEPIDVEDMHNLMAKSYLVMTDSGGLQEEAVAFGVPVVILRTETERMEAVEAGTAVIGGNTETEIYRVVSTLLNDEKQYLRMSHAKNPYGDGHAGERIIEDILTWSDTRQKKKMLCEQEREGVDDFVISNHHSLSG